MGDMDGVFRGAVMGFKMGRNTGIFHDRLCSGRSADFMGMARNSSERPDAVRRVFITGEFAVYPEFISGFYTRRQCRRRIFFSTADLRITGAFILSLCLLETGTAGLSRAALSTINRASQARPALSTI